MPDLAGAGLFIRDVGFPIFMATALLLICLKLWKEGTRVADRFCDSLDKLTAAITVQQQFVERSLWNNFRPYDKGNYLHGEN